MLGPPWDRALIPAPAYPLKGTLVLRRSAFATMLESHRADIDTCSAARVSSGDGRRYVDLTLRHGRIIAATRVQDW
jgi:hypothetical protein